MHLEPRFASGSRRLITGLLALAGAALLPACELAPVPGEGDPASTSAEEEETDQRIVIDVGGKVIKAPFEPMAQAPLRRAAQSPENWRRIMTETYGLDHDAQEAERLRKLVARGVFSWTPPAQLVKKGALGGYLAAYSEEARLVFIDESLPEGIERAKAYIEEIGHHLDIRLNRQDTPGDEGYLFGQLLLGNSLSAEELDFVKRFDDTGTFTWEGRELKVEHLGFPPLKCVIFPPACVVDAILKAFDYGGLPTVGDIIDWGTRQSYAGRDMLTSWVPQGVKDAAGRAFNLLTVGQFNPLTYVQDINQLRSVFGAQLDSIKEGAALMKRSADRIASGDYKGGMGDLVLGLSYAAAVGQANPDFIFTFGQELLTSLQTRLGLEQSGRALRGEEVALLKMVFGNGINTNPIIIKEGFAGMLSIKDRPLTLDNTIYLKNHYSYKLLVHEATHVWQYQKHGVSYKLEALDDQQAGYIWATGFQSGNHFKDLHPEAQAKLIENGYNDLIGRGHMVAHSHYGAGVSAEAATRYFNAALRMVSEGAWNGRYFRRADNTSVYRMASEDSVCWVTWDQWLKAGSPAIAVVDVPVGEVAGWPYSTTPVTTVCPNLKDLGVVGGGGPRPR
jgi:hypothetical protein